MKPMKFSFAAALVLSLSACTTTIQSGSHYYRAAGESASVSISGTATRDELALSPEFTVDIRADGTPICSGPAPGKLFGSLRGKTVECDCMTTSGATSCALIGSSFSCSQESNLRCFVFVDGERAADIAFKP